MTGGRLPINSTIPEIIPMYNNKRERCRCIVLQLTIDRRSMLVYVGIRNLAPVERCGRFEIWNSLDPSNQSSTWVHDGIGTATPFSGDVSLCRKWLVRQIEWMPYGRLLKNTWSIRSSGSSIINQVQQTVGVIEHALCQNSLTPFFSSSQNLVWWSVSQPATMEQDIFLMSDPKCCWANSPWRIKG